MSTGRIAWETLQSRPARPRSHFSAVAAVAPLAGGRPEIVGKRGGRAQSGSQEPRRAASPATCLQGLLSAGRRGRGLPAEAPAEAGRPAHTHAGRDAPPTVVHPQPLWRGVQPTTYPRTRRLPWPSKPRTGRLILATRASPWTKAILRSPGAPQGARRRPRVALP